MANDAICKHCERYVASYITDSKQTLTVCRIYKYEKIGLRFYSGGDVAVLNPKVIPDSCIYQLEQTLSLQ